MISKEDLNLIAKEADSIIDTSKQRDKILSQLCKLLQDKVFHYDWVGFYILNNENNILELGPYVGKPTDHTEIPVGKGVCGQVAEKNKPMTVQDVSKIDNYIACSLEVQSEIVVPIKKEGKFVAEIDIDSHATAPFTKEDTTLLENICNKVSHLF